MYSYESYYGLPTAPPPVDGVADAHEPYAAAHGAGAYEQTSPLHAYSPSGCHDAGMHADARLPSPFHPGVGTSPTSHVPPAHCSPPAPPDATPQVPAWLQYLQRQYTQPITTPYYGPAYTPHAPHHHPSSYPEYPQSYPQPYPQPYRAR